jgi:hypothetical protein
MAGVRGIACAGCDTGAGCSGTDLAHEGRANENKRAAGMGAGDVARFLVKVAIVASIQQVLGTRSSVLARRTENVQIHGGRI